MRQEDFPEFMAKYKESYLEEIKYARDTIDKILNKDQLVRLRQIEFQWYLTHGQPRKAFAICGKNVSPEQAEAIRQETSPLFTQLHYLKQELEFEFEVEALKRLYATKRIEEPYFPQFASEI